jgi:hypothetical protein
MLCQNKLLGYFFMVGVVFLCGVLVTTTTQAQGLLPTATVFPDNIASFAEVAQAMASWELSEHAHTYDEGLGADTTCARCKSPLNWDPFAPAAEAALDCASCKRVPGEARPVLDGGVPVSETEWQHIGCPICHEPIGDSYRITPAFWNQELGTYEPVESTDELCAQCHEGQHGFEVTEEILVDQAHIGWGCLDCHGPHGDDVDCVDCHDIFEGAGTMEHANHMQVHCSACHDQGGLPLWNDRDIASPFYGTIITVCFAHTLTSWPSHNLRAEVQCGRCHHARGSIYPAIAETISCDNSSCHPQGAVLYWCPTFARED